MVQIRLNKNDLNMIIVFSVVIIIILAVLFIYMFSGKDYYNSLVKPNFAPPPWLFMIMMVITLIVVGYVGVIIMNHSGKHKELCFSLWVAQIIVLFGAFVAFFQREQIEVTAYLLMLFLAIHSALTFKLQYVDTLSATLYLVGAVWMLYVIITVLELSDLN